jgi:TolB-like protein
MLNTLVDFLRAALRKNSRHNRAMSSFFNELKRRNVFRVAAAYALVAWILIEAGSVLLPTFGAPEWFFKVYVMLVFAGFVVSLIFAWVFEITPDGVRLEKDLDRSHYDPARRGGLNLVLIVLLVVALVVSISFNLSGVRETESALNPDRDLSSVAVLPFENRSADPENGYFADGIQDDLLTRLADIEALHVISRTSANEYRNTTKKVSVIGEELGVATIVQGAVQRSGDNVRISVWLIDAQADKQIWARTYDEDASLKDVFELQTEISSQITASLHAALTPEEQQRNAAVPTQNIEAYRLFVQGQINLGQRRFNTLHIAREQFEQAIQLDPDYAQAHAALAETIMVLYVNHAAINPGEARRLARVAADNALRLDPINAEAYAVQGFIEANQWQQTHTGAGNIRAADAFRKALELNSNVANAYVWFSTLRENENDIDGAIEMLTQALEVDPRSRIPFVNLSALYALQGENNATTELLLKAMEFFPEWELPIRYLSQHLQRLGRLDEAVAWSVEIARISDDPLAGSNAIGIYRTFGDADAISAFMADFPADHPVTPIGIGLERFVSGDYQGTLDALEDIEADSLGTQAMVIPLLVRSAILLEDYEQARDLLLQNNPQLSADQAITVNRFNLSAAVMLAFIEQRRGNTDAADLLLEQALTVTTTLPRVGYSGYGIRDVQILTLQGRISAALDTLRDAIDEGFVSQMPFDFWTVDVDPLLAPLLSEPRFIEMRAEVQAHIDTMRQTVEAARAADDWTELRSRASQNLSAAIR